MAGSKYESLKQKLNEVGEWPRVYLFKFIIPSDNKKLALVEALFGPEAQVLIKQSNKGNYVSLSAKELMLDADGIIERYKKAEQIEGLIAL
tara:strand:+ start:207 stop:479 length:273 start_codon:yes stop_codon:yes gene_type:complete